jgi:hypothetical protein
MKFLLILVALTIMSLAIDGGVGVYLLSPIGLLIIIPLFIANFAGVTYLVLRLREREPTKFSLNFLSYFIFILISSVLGYVSEMLFSQNGSHTVNGEGGYYFLVITTGVFIFLVAKFIKDKDQQPVGFVNAFLILLLSFIIMFIVLGIVINSA